MVQQLPDDDLALADPADIADNKGMELGSMFRIASMTKAITSVAVMTLYEQGYFLLSDLISKYIPEFKKLAQLK